MTGLHQARATPGLAGLVAIMAVLLIAAAF
jgi:hypothetical protein